MAKILSIVADYPNAETDWIYQTNDYITSPNGKALSLASTSQPISIGCAPSAIPSQWAGTGLYLMGDSALPFIAVLNNGSSDGKTATFASYTTDVHKCTITLVGAGGTSASPTAAQNGNEIGSFNFEGQWGTSGSQHDVGARIVATAEGNFSGTSYPTSISFYTTNTSETTPTERVKIDEAGLLNAYAGLNTTALTLEPDVRVGQDAIEAGNTSVTIPTAAASVGNYPIVSIGGYTGTASLALGAIAVTNITEGVSFEVSVATAVPATSTVLVNWVIFN